MAVLASGRTPFVRLVLEDAAMDTVPPTQNLVSKADMMNLLLTVLSRIPSSAVAEEIVVLGHLITATRLKIGNFPLRTAVATRFKLVDAERMTAKYFALFLLTLVMTNPNGLVFLTSSPKLDMIVFSAVRLVWEILKEEIRMGMGEEIRMALVVALVVATEIVANQPISHHQERGAVPTLSPFSVQL